MQNRLYQIYIKRILDIILSLIALVVLSPLLLVVSLLVRVKLGSPVIFKQARPGMNEKIFYLYKFRSMTNAVGEDGKLLPDAQRLTKLGKFLRASSIDELLELVNIIKGDMSIVGPRPLSIYYLPHYPMNLRKRHDVRPGLTGLAQVSGRNNLPWDDRFELDIKYVENISFFLDVKIILQTVLKVLKRADVTVRGTTKVKDYGPYCVLKEEGTGSRKMGDMTYSEIGSYFWLDDEAGQSHTVGCSWLPEVEDSSFTFSGRNSIDLVLRDILANKIISKAYVPSYCCVSMLQAFIDHGIPYEFYRVEYKDGEFKYHVPKTDSSSVVLIMSYFGLETDNAYKAIESVKANHSIVIEDITHSLLREKSCSDDSDYLVASLRKWFAVPAGGWIGKKTGSLSQKPDINSNHAVENKISAMHEKYSYLTGVIDSKENFLLENSKFDNDLIHIDRMLKIDDTSMKIISSLNINEIINKRRSNAAKLIDGLNNLPGNIIELPSFDPNGDAPLFVPVFMNTEERDSLRTYLIQKGIYCPVHWPEVMGAPAGIRENELSLICDQRYTTGDMQAIVDTIQEWCDINTRNTVKN